VVRLRGRASLSDYPEILWQAHHEKESGSRIDRNPKEKRREVVSVY
jgi:hypothetical protein